MTKPSRPTLTRSLIGGTVAGVAASAAMSGALALIARHEAENGGSSTEKTAEAVSEAAMGEEVPAADKKQAGKLVHYATGAALGALYGVGARWLPETRAGWGTAYGLAISAVLDEGIVPALGLSTGPTEASLSDHVEGGIGHLVFGFALESVTRVIVGAPGE